MSILIRDRLLKRIGIACRMVKAAAILIDCGEVLVCFNSEIVHHTRDELVDG